MLNKSQDTEGLVQALRLDRAISSGVVEHRFGIEKNHLHQLEIEGKFFLVNHSLNVTHGSRQAKDVTFVCCDQRTADLTGTMLRHVAGIAGMRHQLGASHWRITMFQNPNRWYRYSGLIPDALWREPGNERETAIEFDMGSHVLETVRAKSSTYLRHNTRQIWAAPSARRALSLVNVLEELNADPLMWQVLVVDWIGI